MVVPTTEWSILTWDELSFSQKFSIELTNFIIHEMAQIFNMDYAYVPHIQRHIGRFCWDVLCACIPALPIVEESDIEMLGLSPRTLSYVFYGYRLRLEDKHRYRQSVKHDGEHTRVDVDEWIHMWGLMHFEAVRAGTPYSNGPFHKQYIWIPGCLVTFCLRLAEPVYVAHEVEQMVQKMRADGSTESVGIILSSQQELVVVAVDRRQVRHTPVLDLRPVDSKPGRASDGRFLLTRLLSPLFTTSPLPWRIQPRHFATSTANLPPEVLQIIVNHADMGTYVVLCQVSRLVRLV
ncbi:hypothetical protein RSOL_422420 [Rhizoctonia solani AG-3 Rhs1AP]|uniref:F-box domain-containing protein n=1 Tax=Rhizoctonia solani AG-3 Rhs1AP TaxID=1086054 RepID=X8JFN1_9AGAM|nr:hypothetical protein RSOL_422420 [Rhizoctonia solani AG-3 Rhs1AP]